MCSRHTCGAVCMSSMVHKARQHTVKMKPHDYIVFTADVGFPPRFSPVLLLHPTPVPRFISITSFLLFSYTPFLPFSFSVKHTLSLSLPLFLRPFTRSFLLWLMLLRLSKKDLP